jgi:hypothetical protein
MIQNIFTTIFSNLFIGIFGSITATAIYLIYDKRKDRKRYGQIDGMFRSELNTSMASIYYMAKNNLEISVKEDNGDLWLGFISLYNEKNGTIDWNYILPEEKIDRFGLKKIIIVDKDNFKLIGEKKENYGVEKFSRLPFKRESTKEFLKRYFKI